MLLDIFNSFSITAGRVAWQNDVAELNRQREDLDDVRARLAEEVDLIQAENEIKGRVAILFYRGGCIHK